jgi:hypothetical protein
MIFPCRRPGWAARPYAQVAAFIAAISFVGATPTLAQTLGQGNTDDISWWRVLAALLLCMALAIGGAFALRARGGASPFLSFAAKQNRRLRLVETLRLSNHVNLCIVDCDGSELLVAVSAQGARLLKPLSAKSNGAELRA